MAKVSSKATVSYSAKVKKKGKKGKITISPPKLSKGKHTLKVTYSGNTQLAAGSSPKKTVKVS